MRKQCALLGISRSALDYVPKPDPQEDWMIRRLLDELYLNDPCLGTRRLACVLERDHGIVVNRKRLQRIRREMGLEAIYCRPRTSLPDKSHQVWPYLLRDVLVDQPDQAWCTDITYVPMPRGHAFLCVIMDWHSRKVLGWSVSNTMDTGLCLRALEQAIRLAGRLPGIMNSDQGSQFTSREWTGRLTGLGVQISMDGKGRYLDNIFIERLWRSVKYESIYLNEYGSIPDLAHGLSTWFAHYNQWRPHEALGNRTPHQVHMGLPLSFCRPKPLPFLQAA
jgi:putative transposase